MQTLSNEHLHDREFGSRLFNVSHFQEWLETKRLSLPITLPADFVQVEMLLCIIERATTAGLDRNEALEIIAADPSLASHRSAARSPVWLVGAEAHRKWREVLNEAVANQELSLLEFGSKLPISNGRQTPAPKVEAVKGIPKYKVVNAFENLHFSRDMWNKYLGDPPNWLRECRTARGSKKASALWNPVQIAVELFGKDIPIKRLDAVFVGLKDWKDEWQAASAYFRD